MRAVLYCRVSSSEQTKNLSLPTQEEACRDYCARHGYAVDQVFVDAGESAKTTDRPEFRRMLEHCRRSRGRLHAVVVYSLTRFSRNTTDHHAISSLLRGLGIALRSVTEPIDDSPSGRLMEGILAAMSQFDNDVRSERVVAGMKAAADRGRWCFAAPVGYINSDPRRGPSLIPDPERAPAIREAFEIAARGITGRALLERVTAMGLTTRRGNAFTLNRLYELLRHPVYAGYVRTETWTLDRRGDFEPLTTDELFRRVQMHLSRPNQPSKTAHRHRNHDDFPLRRFVRCGGCGRFLTASWSKGRRGRYAFYHCTRGCQRIPRARLEDAFLQLLDQLRPRADYWRVLKAATIDVWKRERAGAKTAQAGVRARITNLEAKAARLDERFIYQHAIDAESYQAQRDQLREQIALAQCELAQLTIDDIDVDGLLAFAEHTLTHASALWTNAENTEKRISLQWALFPAGIVWESDTSGGKVRTAVSCLEFFELQPAEDVRKQMVDRPLPSWNQLHAWLLHVSQHFPRAA